MDINSQDGQTKIEKRWRKDSIDHINLVVNTNKDTKI